MRRAFGLIGGLLIIEGVAGIVHELIGWFRLWVIVRYLSFLDGFEYLANVGLVVVGLIVIMIAERGRSTA